MNAGLAEAEKLKAEGYARIVSAGQSFGGWISYFAAVRRAGLFHAIVATAPAMFGEASTSPEWRLNADRLYMLAEKINSTRVMSFFFPQDPYDPGGRGRHIAKILNAHGIPNVMIDRRPGLEGHGVSRTLAASSANVRPETVMASPCASFASTSRLATSAVPPARPRSTAL